MKISFELYKAKDERFRWRLKASNGLILATAGQGYKAKSSAKHGIDLVMSSGTNDKLTYDIYDDDKGETRWRLRAGNGQVIAISSESYKRRRDAEKAVDTIKSSGAKALVNETEA